MIVFNPSRLFAYLLVDIVVPFRLKSHVLTRTPNPTCPHLLFGSTALPCAGRHDSTTAQTNLRGHRTATPSRADWLDLVVLDLHKTDSAFFSRRGYAENLCVVGRGITARTNGTNNPPWINLSYHSNPCPRSPCGEFHAECNHHRSLSCAVALDKQLLTDLQMEFDLCTGGVFCM